MVSFEQAALLAQVEDRRGVSGFVLIIELIVIAVVIAAMWKTFVKAGKPGWASLIPIYNLVVLMQIAGRPLWWVLLLFIPFVNLVIHIIVSIDVAKNFGKGTGFGVGLALLGFIFYPILGFGDAVYAPVPK
jgi:chromate transport protein ChrA